jgi:hypothetical protein
MSESQDVTTVELSADIVTRIEKRTTYTEFEDINDYITYVMEEVLYHVEQENDVSDTEAVDEQEVRNRLESLGYLNE